MKEEQMRKQKQEKKQRKREVEEYTQVLKELIVTEKMLVQMGDC